MPKGLGRGYSFPAPMPGEPPAKRAVAFVDGQNLFYAAREAFGYTYPNYDASALARYLCEGRGWTLTQVRFYTGIPDPEDNAFWHGFWSAKLAVMGKEGVHVFSRGRVAGCLPAPHAGGHSGRPPLRGGHGGSRGDGGRGARQRAPPQAHDALTGAVPGR